MRAKNVKVMNERGHIISSTDRQYQTRTGKTVRTDADEHIKVDILIAFIETVNSYIKMRAYSLMDVIKRDFRLTSFSILPFKTS